MRNPSIHIRLTTLEIILADIGVKNAKKVALQVAAKAVPYNIKNRYYYSGNAKIRERAAKSVAASNIATVSVEKFNTLLTGARNKAGHRFIASVTKTHKDYNLLREITVMACEFAERCGFDNIIDGCQVYLKLGLEIMGRTYSLNKFKTYHERIFQTYEAWDMIANDENKDLTREFFGIYVKLLAEYAGISRDDLEKETEYINFIYAREAAAAVKTDADTWVRSQFQILSDWYDNTPNPAHLHGEHATKRYYSYIQSNVSNKAEDEVVFAKKDSKKDFEAAYAEKRKKYSQE